LTKGEGSTLDQFFAQPIRTYDKNVRFFGNAIKNPLLVSESPLFAN